jgi:hypothetical protein
MLSKVSMGIISFALKRFIRITPFLRFYIGFRVSIYNIRTFFASPVVLINNLPTDL